MILLGDLNADPLAGEETIKLLTERCGLRDPLAGSSGALSYPAEAAERRLDYILATPDLRVRRAEVLQIGPLSDHLPVIAEIV